MTTIDVTYDVRVKASSIPGASPGTYISTGFSPPWAIAVLDEIAGAVDKLFGTYPIGGMEQSGVTGVIYTSEIVDAIHDARRPLWRHGDGAERSDGVARRGAHSDARHDDGDADDCRGVMPWP